MRGEKILGDREGEADQGSPPHARGKARASRRSPPRRGITPACAGKSQSTGRCTGRRWDHPRMRGEKIPAAAGPPACWGSPPHARGKEFAGQIRILLLGITPACAGKRPTPRCAPASPEDHPRMRGEKSGTIPAPVKVVGSPPHARGKGPSSFQSWSDTGITPACAGKSHKFRQKRSGNEDHPRMRGEKRSSKVMMM